MSKTSQQSSEIVNGSKASVTVEDETEVEPDRTEQLSQHIQNLAQCIYTNDARKLQGFIGSLKDKNEIRSLVNSRDRAGKSPLDLTACLGRAELAKQLITYGADVNSFTSKGYTCVHHAAAWGQLSALQALVQCGGNLNRKTVHGELPRDIALRYHQEDCVEYLDVIAETKKLKNEISQIITKLQDLEKNSASKMFKDEKSLIAEMCQEKLEWLSGPNITSQEIAAQLSQLTDFVQFIFKKINDSIAEAGKSGTGNPLAVGKRTSLSK